MGWGIIIKEIELSRVHKDELESKKIELENYITFDKERLMMLASHVPDQSNEDWLMELQNKVDDCLDNYAQNNIELMLVEKALYDLDNVEEF